MSSEIKIGDFYRTTSGIIRKAKTIKSGKRQYTRTTETLVNGTHKLEDIVKHSKNIIDLIEVGDYVNGHLVKAVYLDGATKYIKLDNAYENGNGIRTYEEDIKTVVTKEMYKSVEYKVGV